MASRCSSQEAPGRGHGTCSPDAASSSSREWLGMPMKPSGHISQAISGSIWRHHAAITMKAASMSTAAIMTERGITATADEDIPLV